MYVIKLQHPDIFGAMYVMDHPDDLMTSDLAKAMRFTSKYGATWYMLIRMPKWINPTIVEVPSV